MLSELLVFVPLAFVTNTLVPVPFEVVFVPLVAGARPVEATLFATIGAACAGLAALVDVWLLGRFARARAPRSFYPLAALYAFAPLPYSAIRVLVARERPRASAYAAVTAAARWPRYLLIAFLGRWLALPAWAFAVAIAASIVMILTRTSRRAGPPPAFHAASSPCP